MNFNQVIILSEAIKPHNLSKNLLFPDVIFSIHTSIQAPHSNVYCLHKGLWDICVLIFFYETQIIKTSNVPTQDSGHTNGIVITWDTARFSEG